MAATAVDAPHEEDATKGGSSEAGEAAPAGGCKTAAELKEQGNLAFTRASVLKKTTAGKQYLQEAKSCYVEAITKLSDEAANDQSLGLVCTLHSNLAAVFLLEQPPKWAEAKAAADIALAVDARHVKALYRRAQALLEDGREGLPEASLREALQSLDAAREAEPGNEQVAREAERIRRRVAKLEAARRVPGPAEIAGKISSSLRDRGGDCLESLGYVWGQTETSVHIFVPARGARLGKSSEIEVEFRPRSLRLAMPTSDEGSKPFELAGRLHKLIRADDSSWQLEDGGLVLHIELVKRIGLGDDGEAGVHDECSEHWFCVWEGHPHTMAPSAKERSDVRQMAKAANRMEAQEGARKEPDKPAAADALKRMRDMFPDVNVEWGDTSLEAWR